MKSIEAAHYGPRESAIPSVDTVRPCGSSVARSRLRLRHKDQANVIVHQELCQAGGAVGRTGLTDQGRISAAGVVGKKRAADGYPLRDMMRNLWNDNARQAGHEPLLAAKAASVYLVLCPRNCPELCPRNF